MSHRPARLVAAMLAAAASVVTALVAAPAAQSAPPAPTRPISVAYIEVNSNSISSVGRYTLASSGENVFDIGIIFAANINYDGTKAYLHFNENVQRVLDNAETTIRPLQAKGIKVYLSILGNHEGAGFANFPDQASAAAFAQQLADAEDRYGLDGIDFDDEWSEYGKNGTGQPNAWSFPYLVQALRQAAPDKDISLYYYGPSSQTLSYDGIEVGDLIDYAWNPYYGAWLVPDVPGLTRNQLGPAAVNIQGTPADTAAKLARKTVNKRYGVYLTYNLPDTDASAYVSSFTQELYGSAAVFK